MITREHERELAIRAKAGDQRAFSELLEGHAGFFAQMAHRSGVDPEDALQEIHMAAFNSLKSFDPDRGIRFLTYAAQMGKWGVARFRDSDNIIRLPQKQSFDKGSESLQQLAANATRMVSTDIRLENSRDSLGATLADSRDFVQDISEAEELSLLATAINRLPEREGQVVRSRMAGKTLDEIGMDLGVSRERVRQIEADAHKRLRVSMSQVSKLELPRLAGAPWVNVEREYLRKHFETSQVLQISRDLGRGYTSVIKTCHDLGLRKLFRWTPHYDRILKLNRHEGWRKCAELIGVTSTAVHNRVRRLGIAQDHHLTGYDYSEMKRLHAAGKTTIDIAAALGCTDECVRYNFRRYDVVANKRNEKRRMGTLRETLLAKHGVSNPSAVRQLIYERRAEELGYPGTPFWAAAILCILKAANQGLSVYKIAANITTFFNARGWGTTGKCLSGARKWCNWLLSQSVINRVGGGSAPMLYFVTSQSLAKVA